MDTSHVHPYFLNRDSPNELAPTATVGLFDDSIAGPEGHKLFPGSSKAACARRRIVIPCETPFGRGHFFSSSIMVSAKASPMLYMILALPR